MLDGRLYYPRSLLILQAVLVLTLLGCSQIVTGGFTDSPDKKWRMYGRCFWGYGCNSSRSSSKTVRITIVVNDEHQKTLLGKDYRVRGSDIGWEAAWDEADNLSVTLYDYGDGIAFHGLEKDEPPKRVLRKLFYRFNTKTGRFAERPAK